MLWISNFYHLHPKNFQNNSSTVENISNVSKASPVQHHSLLQYVGVPAPHHGTVLLSSIWGKTTMFL